MAGSQDDIPPPPPPPSQTPTQQTPHNVSTIKLPILKKGEYDIWAMKMEYYLTHTDYPIWEVIQTGNGPVSIHHKNSRFKSEDHLAKFHKMTDAKEMWNAIKSRFGRNDESKKMQKYILKQQFEGFSVSNSEGLHKGYDRFQSLLSQLEIHGAGVYTEDANQKFLRSLPSSWSQASNCICSSLPECCIVSENTSSTNDVSTAYGVSNPSGQNSQYEHASSYSLHANQSSCPQLDHEDLEQLDEFDLEEMDLKWQVAMISMRMKKFYKKTGRKLQFDAKEPVGFDKTKVECYNCHKTGHFARECRTKGNQDSKSIDAWNSRNKDGRRSSKQEGRGRWGRGGVGRTRSFLVTIDGEGVDWTSHSEEEEDFALMACNSSGSDREVQSCSNECVASYNKLKKYSVEQRTQLVMQDRIKAYTQALKKETLGRSGDEKEKDDLKAKVGKIWHNSSKNLSLLQNSQMSANDKFGLGYGDHRYDGILSYENEVLQSVFMNKESDLENQPLYNRFVTAEGMHTYTILSGKLYKLEMVGVSTNTNGLIKVLPPKTAEEILARERERKARTTLLMALPEDHLAKFHKITDAKEMWEAIKSRFGGNDESKKMQKYILKQQFEGFSVSNSEGLHKGYDRFQSLLSQLEIHGAGVSTKDANQKFLRSLPSAWSQVSLIMRTKPGVDSLSFDDLYNNLRVFESNVKGTSASSSSNQNAAFVSENTSSTNEVSTTYGASSSSSFNPQKEGSTNNGTILYSFLANQSSGPQVDHEDLE
ncbi:ribonuclease H-like domain-containing protein [Tanacetum coccineum]